MRLTDLSGRPSDRRLIDNYTVLQKSPVEGLGAEVYFFLFHRIRHSMRSQRKEEDQDRVKLSKRKKERKKEKENNEVKADEDECVRTVQRVFRVQGLITPAGETLFTGLPWNTLPICHPHRRRIDRPRARPDTRIRWTTVRHVRRSIRIEAGEGCLQCNDPHFVCCNVNLFSVLRTVVHSL